MRLPRRSILIVFLAVSRRRASAAPLVKLLAGASVTCSAFPPGVTACDSVRALLALDASHVCGDSAAAVGFVLIWVFTQ